MPYRSIFLLDNIWLSYEQEVEFARAALLDDDADQRVYITGLDAPRFTNYALATSTGSPPYPAETRLLGVPPAQDPPVATVTVTPPAESNITLTNSGAEAGTTAGWTIDAGGLIALQNGDVPGLNAQAGTWFFGGGSAVATQARQDVTLEALGVIPGQGLELAWWQATGASGSLASMAIRFLDDTSQQLSEVALSELAMSPALTWVQRTLSTQVPDGAVTARLVQLYTRVGAGPAIDAYIDTITLNSIDFTNSFDGSSLSGWTVSPSMGSISSNNHRFVLVADTGGWPPPAIFLQFEDVVPWFHRNFSTDRSPGVTLQFDYQETITRGPSGLHAMLFASDSGIGTSVFFSSWGGVQIYSHSSWDTIGASIDQIAAPGVVGIGTRYTVTLTASQISSVAASIVIRIVNANTGDVVVNNASSTISIDGPRVGFKGSPAPRAQSFFIDNINVTVAAPDPQQEDESIFTSYVFTYVNEFGEEGPPSEASDTIQRNDNATTIVVTPTGLPTGISFDYGIVSKRIYRAATGALGTVFRFVAEIGLNVSDYTDTVADADLGDVMESDDWDLPPGDLRYILALPNGIMVGASRNRLCLSVQNRPHAWPVAYRLPTDSPITGLANIDTSVIIGTQTFVYTASGNSPDSYSMSKPGAPHACLSARSMAELLRIGAVFAGADGIMAVNGPTDVINLTDPIFTRDQWQELGPETILGIAHDDIYFFFYGTSEGTVPRGGFALDMKPNGFGLIKLGMHAIALATDFERDALMMVLDEYEEPEGNLLSPDSAASVPIDGRTIFEWDAGATLMRYSWRGKLWLNPYPKAWPWVRVRAADYDDLEIQFYADGVLLHQQLVTSNRAFRLPVRATYNRIDWIAVGSSTVQTVELADDPDELV